MEVKDLTGKKFGELTAIGYRTHKNTTMWLCQCSCGNRHEVLRRNLLKGDTRSCGCKKRVDAIANFWTKVRKSDGCWEWTGYIASHGYGLISVSSKRTYAHRFSWELTNGAIPIGLVIDHLCMNRSCVRPDHLEVVTNHENWRRGFSVPAMRSRQQACSNDHALIGDNLVTLKRGGRDCRTCQKLRGAQAYARRSASVKRDGGSSSMSPGDRFGSLIFVGPVDNDPNSKERHRKGRFACDCGGSKVTQLRYVRDAVSRSCGCLPRAPLEQRKRWEMS